MGTIAISARHMTIPIEISAQLIFAIFFKTFSHLRILGISL